MACSARSAWAATVCLTLLATSGACLLRRGCRAGKRTPLGEVPPAAPRPRIAPAVPRSRPGDQRRQHCCCCPSRPRAEQPAGGECQPRQLRGGVWNIAVPGAATLAPMRRPCGGQAPAILADSSWRLLLPAAGLVLAWEAGRMGCGQHRHVHQPPLPGVHATPCILPRPATPPTPHMHAPCRAQAVAAAGLTETLSNPELTWTVLAPTNDVSSARTIRCGLWHGVLLLCF